MNIGHKDIIRIEIGEGIDGSPDLFKLDVWLLGQHITTTDNIAYLKSVIAQAEIDLIENRDLKRFANYFKGMSAQEAHNFILSTRDSEAENYDIENDQIYPNQQILNWGPNTDNVACFLVPLGNSIYATIEHHDTEEKTGSIFAGEIDLSLFNETIKAFIKCGANKI